MERLRGWLEVDHGVDFPALPFLYEMIDQISSDGDVTEDELDRLALAIERVLPKDIRLAATAKRQQARDARRVAQRETQRQILIAARAERRAARDTARARAGVLYEADFPVRGATRLRSVVKRVSGSWWITTLSLSESQTISTTQTRSSLLETMTAN
jgi:hypothetical protein